MKLRPPFMASLGLWGTVSKVLQYPMVVFQYVRRGTTSSRSNGSVPVHVEAQPAPGLMEVFQYT